MTEAGPPGQGSPVASSTIFTARLAKATRAAGPPLLFGLRLWVSVCLALYIAFWLELDDAYWAGTTAALVCQPQLGASLRKGWFRMVGTLVGAVAIVILTACFPQNRFAFLAGLAFWGAGCALAATILRNSLAVAAQLAGITAAIIASSQLGDFGGANGDAFMLAVIRCTEICIGIVSAGVVLAGTDFGRAQRRLAAVMADISTEVMRRFVRTLALAGPGLPETQPIRQELLRRVIALDSVIDETIGESAQLRYHSPVLQTAVNGLFDAITSWRVAAVHLAQLPHDQARQGAAAVLQAVPKGLLSAPEQEEPARWIDAPIGVDRACDAGVRALIALPAGTPSLRLLADQSAKVLAGISRALNGLALLVGASARPMPRRGGVLPCVPDRLPPLINASRAFIAVAVVEFFWILTAWPNGARAITFAAIGVILFAPRADQAYAGAMSFMVGIGLTAVFAAIIGFAILPNIETFAAFSLAIGLVLVPAGAGVAQPWQTPMFTAIAAFFCFLLTPTNPMSYDTQQFYNAASATVAGAGAAALSFRLLPSLSPMLRARRLLTLTLRDLRRLATGWIPRSADAWEGRVYSRLSELPDAAEPLQRSQLVAALSVGIEIISLRRICRRFDLGPHLDAALETMARGDSAMTIARLTRLDEALAARPRAAALRARSTILAMSEALTEHATYFDAEAPS
jgi:uncharacterized membrane protein YccC